MSTWTTTGRLTLNLGAILQNLRASGRALTLSAVLIGCSGEAPEPAAVPTPRPERACLEPPQYRDDREATLCAFECEQVAGNGKAQTTWSNPSFEKALESCSRGWLRAVGGGAKAPCLIDAFSVTAVDRPKLRVELDDVTFLSDAKLIGSRFRRLQLTNAEIRGALSLEGVELSEELILDTVTVFGPLSLDDASADGLRVEQGNFYHSSTLTGFRAAKDIELVQSRFCGTVDASRLTAAGGLDLIQSRFDAPDTTLIGYDPVDFSFAGATADSLDATQTEFVGTSSFNSARIATDVHFRATRFHGFVTAGQMTVGGVLTLNDAVATGSESSSNPWYELGHAGCKDGGAGTSLELYRTRAAVLDLRSFHAEARILNLNESEVGRLDIGQVHACGVLLSAAKVGTLNIDQPSDGGDGLGIGDTDARGLIVEHVVSRRSDPVESMRTAVGRVEGARELFAQLAAELHGAGQFEGANRAYVIAQWSGTNLLDPSDYLFLMTGDGRYPLWIYGLAFVALYCFAYATFRKEPAAWREHREKVPYNAALFALDVITPSILDLGYRGAEVFGDDPRATRLHSTFHVLGVVLLGLALVAIGVRLP